MPPWYQRLTKKWEVHNPGPRADRSNPKTPADGSKPRTTATVTSETTTRDTNKPDTAAITPPLLQANLTTFIEQYIKDNLLDALKHPQAQDAAGLAKWLNSCLTNPAPTKPIDFDDLNGFAASVVQSQILELTAQYHNTARAAEGEEIASSGLPKHLQFAAFMNLRQSIIALFEGTASAYGQKLSQTFDDYDFGDPYQGYEDSRLPELEGMASCHRLLELVLWRLDLAFLEEHHNGDCFAFSQDRQNWWHQNRPISPFAYLMPNIVTTDNQVALFVGAECQEEFRRLITTALENHRNGDGTANIQLILPAISDQVKASAGFKSLLKLLEQTCEAGVPTHIVVNTLDHHQLLAQINKGYKWSYALRQAQLPNCLTSLAKYPTTKIRMHAPVQMLPQTGQFIWRGLAPPLAVFSGDCALVGDAEVYLAATTNAHHHTTSIVGPAATLIASQFAACWHQSNTEAETSHFAGGPTTGTDSEFTRSSPPLAVGSTELEVGAWGLYPTNGISAERVQGFAGQWPEAPLLAAGALRIEADALMMNKRLSTNQRSQLVPNPSHDGCQGVWPYNVKFFAFSNRLRHPNELHQSRSMPWLGSTYQILPKKLAAIVSSEEPCAAAPLVARNPQIIVNDAAFAKALGAFHVQQWKKAEEPPRQPNGNDELVAKFSIYNQTLEFYSGGLQQLYRQPTTKTTEHSTYSQMQAAGILALGALLRLQGLSEGVWYDERKALEVIIDSSNQNPWSDLISVLGRPANWQEDATVWAAMARLKLRHKLKGDRETACGTCEPGDPWLKVVAAPEWAITSAFIEEALRQIRRENPLGNNALRRVQDLNLSLSDTDHLALVDAIALGDPFSNANAKFLFKQMLDNYTTMVASQEQPPFAKEHAELLTGILSYQCFLRSQRIDEPEDLNTEPSDFNEKHRSQLEATLSAARAYAESINDSVSQNLKRAIDWSIELGVLRRKPAATANDRPAQAHANPKKPAGHSAPSKAVGGLRSAVSMLQRLAKAHLADSDSDLSSEDSSDGDNSDEETWTASRGKPNDTVQTTHEPPANTTRANPTHAVLAAAAQRLGTDAEFAISDIEDDLRLIKEHLDLVNAQLRLRESILPEAFIKQVLATPLKVRPLDNPTKPYLDAYIKGLQTRIAEAKKSYANEGVHR